ncbi:MAG: hypothetical protein IJJ67_03065 [Oscillospiraceae bacterium]|nr:hypothetical protein [Oscillospiraceae bacterium]
MKRISVLLLALIISFSLCACGDKTKSENIVSTPTISEEENDPYRVGAIIKFGKYEQDNKIDNGMEEIEWKILERDSDKALIISKNCLDCQPYNTESKEVTWETSSIRKWLNKDFIESAFSNKEQELIISSSDKVFLLSKDEANKYFNTDSARQAKGTAYAVAHGEYVISDGGSRWWLRSSSRSSSAPCIGYRGAIASNGLGVFADGITVRPALWINITEKIEKVEPNNPNIEHEHNWIPATNATPATCSICGVRKGGAPIDGAWRDKPDKDNIQYELVIDTNKGIVYFNSIENKTTSKLFDMEIDEYSDDYIMAGGMIITYIDDNTLSTDNDSLFTDPPLKRYSYGTQEVFDIDYDNPQKKDTTTGSDARHTDAEAFTIACEIVESKLKSPSTAKFCKVTEAGIEHLGNGRYRVKGWVDAQNSFGATLRQTFQVTYTAVKKGNDIGYREADCSIY